MNTWTKWLLGAGIILLALSPASAASGSLAALSYLGQSSLPSGMRRNNPGNIIRGVNYQGEIFQDTNRFAMFSSWVYGIRAMIVLVRKYIVSGSSYPNSCVTTPQNTVRLIITQWAPPYSCGGDNAASAVNNYIQFVAGRLGVSADKILTADKATLRKLVMAMAAFEQGRECVTAAEFDYAYNLL